ADRAVPRLRPRRRGGKRLRDAGGPELPGARQRAARRHAVGGVAGTTGRKTMAVGKWPSPPPLRQERGKKLLPSPVAAAGEGEKLLPSPVAAAGEGEKLLPSPVA